MQGFLWEREGGQGNRKAVKSNAGIPAILRQRATSNIFHCSSRI